MFVPDILLDQVGKELKKISFYRYFICMSSLLFINCYGSSFERKWIVRIAVKSDIWLFSLSISRWSTCLCNLTLWVVLHFWKCNFRKKKLLLFASTPLLGIALSRWYEKGLSKYTSSWMLTFNCSYEVRMQLRSWGKLGIHKRSFMMKLVFYTKRSTLAISNLRHNSYVFLLSNSHLFAQYLFR